MDELAILKLVTARLDVRGIPYMLTGSLAAAAYAQPRMTRDIDLIIEIGEAEAAGLAALFDADFLLDPESIRTAVRDRGMFNLIHTAAVIKVDFIVRKDEPFRRLEFQRRRRMLVAGQPMWTVSPEDLILSKLVWARPSHSEMQLLDVRTLLSGGVALDLAYLDHWAGELDIIELWQEVRLRCCPR